MADTKNTEIVRAAIEKEAVATGGNNGFRVVGDAVLFKIEVRAADGSSRSTVEQSVPTRSVCHLMLHSFLSVFDILGLLRVQAAMPSDFLREDTVMAERAKARAGLYQFPEAGEGRFALGDIEDAFRAARKRVGCRSVRGKKAGRTTLANGRLTREIGPHYGEQICTAKSGRGSHPYFFASELVAAAVEALAGKAAA